MTDWGADARSADARGAGPADSLPDALPPFDIPKALERTMGRRDLLRKMLVRFAGDYADAAARLARLIAAGELTEAIRLAHTLKGLALTLEIDGLADPAQALEQACRTGALDAAPMLIGRVETALVPALAAVRSLAPAADAPAAAVAGAVDGATLAARLDELDGLLARNSFRARRAFDELRPELAAVAPAAPVAAIADHLAALDFRAAAQALRSVRAGLRTPAEA